jgi:hypothetical protein
VSESFQEKLLTELREVVGVLSRGLEDSDLRRLLASVGWDLDAITGLPIERVRDALRALDTALNGLPASPPRNLKELSDLLKAALAAFEAVAALNKLVTTPPDPRLEELGHDLLSFAVTTYLYLQHPVLYRVLVLLTVIEPTDIDLIVDRNDAQSLLRLPHRRPVFRAGQIPALIPDPVEVLETEYLGPRGTPPRDNPLDTKEDARQLSNKLFPRVAALLSQMGVLAGYGVKDYGQNFGAAGDDLAARTLTVLLGGDQQPTVATMTGMSFVLLSREEADLGLVVTPFGAAELTTFVGNWRLIFNLSAEVDGFAVGRRGLLVQTGATVPGRIDVSIDLLRLPGDGSPDGAPLAFVIGGDTGTRLEIGQFGANVNGAFQGPNRDFGFLLSATKCALIVDGGDGNSFVDRVLGASPLRIDFAIAVGWSRARGLAFRGAGVLEVDFPMNLSIAGVVDVLAAKARIATEVDASAGGDGGLDLELSARLRAHLGLVTVVLDRVGLRTHLTFPGENGNLGPLNADVSFKPPSTIGIQIEAGPVAGGGFLFVDGGRYGGALVLKVYSVTVKAFGLIETKLPDGAKGFSFVIVISAEFTAIQLGLGFTLNGVGGIIGINRRIDEKGLQQAVRDGSLEHLLFPHDVENNAPQIIHDLQAILPATEGRHVFGPMAKIGWGTPTVIEAEIGIILELPGPRLALLGEVHALLPKRDKGLVVLNLSVAGLLDFPRKFFAIDAPLHDSKVGSYPITGDMAMRLLWGDNVNDTTAKRETVTFLKEPFAKAQFLQLSDAAKLSAPSFEPLDGAIRVPSNDNAIAGGSVEEPKEIKYKTKVLGAPAFDEHPLPEEHLAGMKRRSATGLFGLRRVAAEAYIDPMAPPRFIFGSELFVIGNRKTFKTPGGILGGAVSKIEAALTLAEHLANNPEEQDDLQVFPKFEMGGRV